MPSWFSNKTNTLDVKKKKKSLESIFDSARRKLKPKLFREEKRSLSLHPSSETSIVCLGLASPRVLESKDASGEAFETVSFPLPSIPSPNTDSDSKCAHAATADELPPSFDEHSSMPEPAPDCGEYIFPHGSRSASSVCSQESISITAARSSNGSCNITSSSLLNSTEDAVNGLDQESFGVTNGGLSTSRYMTMISRQGIPQLGSSHLIRRLSDSHAGTVLQTISPLVLRRYSDKHSDGISPFQRGAIESIGAEYSSGSSLKSSRVPLEHFAASGPIMERSPGPSPGLSPRLYSAAVSPSHSHAWAGRQESRAFHHKNKAHPLPLPPSTFCSPERPFNFQTGWRKGTLLGCGTFGHVYTGFHSESGQSCAIKEVLIIPDNERSMENARQLMQEISLLSKIKHTNIVQYYGSEMVNDRLYIYLEFMSNGSIHQLVKQYGPLSERCIRVYTRQILSGLSYLHAKNTVHRDIKGANILVDKGGVVKLADFGMAKHISAQSFPLSLKGSPYWMAPEVIRNVNGYDFAVDIWSLGCTVLEMATGKPPWSEFEGIAALFRIGNSKELPSIPEFLSHEGRMFLKGCFQRDPQKRPTAEQLLDHPFVAIHECDHQLGMRVRRRKGHVKTVSCSGIVSAPSIPSFDGFPSFVSESGFPPELCLSPVSRSVSGSVAHGGILLNAFPCHERSFKCAETWGSPHFPTGPGIRKYSNRTLTQGRGSFQTPESSPRHHNVCVHCKQVSPSSAYLSSGDMTADACPASNFSSIHNMKEHASHRRTQSSQQYHATTLQTGFSSPLGHINRHNSGCHAEHRHRVFRP